MPGIRALFGLSAEQKAEVMDLVEQSRMTQLADRDEPLAGERGSVIAF